MKGIGFFICLTALQIVGSMRPAMAQADGSGCSVSNITSLTQTIHCANGLTIVVEHGARYELGNGAGKGEVNAVELSDKALLLEVAPKPGRKSFEVNTPQAIAAVRGTRWAVDVSDAKTSVLVIRGRVAVGRRTGPRATNVTLGPGDGVDVEPSAPLVVKKWAPGRVAALMARFGQ